MGEAVPGEGYSANSDAERQELANVLASPAFARSQRLVKLLEYIAEKHFQNQAGEVCEYNIATEVLGRPADFDPAEDAIARVEIHRLRKKLREHYAGEGARQSLKIIIPPGMYTPVFQRDANVSAEEAPTNGKPPGEAAGGETTAPGDEGPAPPPPAVAASTRGRTGLWLTIAAVVTVAAATAVFAIWPPAARIDPEITRQATAPVWAIAADNSIRIVAGYDRKYIDHNGHTWMPDRFFEGGGKPGAPFRQFIARTPDPLLYQNGRIGVTAYNIPLKPGNYELKLHFVEPVYGPGLETGGGENSRVFDILLNGKLAIDGFDIVADAGAPLTADTRIFKDVQPGADGILRIGFHPKREQPIISGLEVEPAEPHRMNPIRIVTQPNSVTDSHGQVWEADNYFYGGQTSNHWKSVSGTPDPDLFANERYGHFTYAIPAAPGTYTATMYFAETYWGKENQGGGGPGQRVFSIFCNGSTLVRNLDILKEAGPNRALIKRFRGLRPNAQGKLDFEFVPVVNYASVFAIEVVDEGP
ncbi:MAG TPA: malectin domain-containing carbohydrate-binding protein [Bryobacteraceae bacterium]|nr:malectin domain-containing carbohydrate-binding protein [Bryobacteraceae bacterium]